jgi:hypothetical protein
MEVTVETEPSIVNPYPQGIRIMSEREADEMSRYGEVLTWSSDSEVEKMTEDKTIGSDTTGSTPECFKSPEVTKT